MRSPFPAVLWFVNVRKRKPRYKKKTLKDLYPSIRCIVDCTEIFIEMPTSYRSQSATLSNCKHHNTAKGFIGISRIFYVLSELYTGRCNDKKITNDCGILSPLEPGDFIMADRSFDIEADLPPGVKLNITPFLWGNAQLELKDELKTRRTAFVHVHVERPNAHIKLQDTSVNISSNYATWIK